jgi:hypothetical protein
LISDQQFSARVREEANQVKTKCKFARKWRDKRLAHTDLMTSGNELAPTLPSVTSQDIADALISMHALLDSVERHYRITQTVLGHDPFAARSLVYRLEQAIRAEESEYRQRPEET